MDLVSTGADVRYLLEFSQNTTPFQLGYPEVMVTDIELYLKAFVYNYVDNTWTCLYEVL